MDQLSGIEQATQARRAGRMLVPLMGIVVVLAMAGAAFAIVLQMQERDKRQAAERELHLARAENEDLKGRFQEAQQAKAAMEDEMGRAKRDVLQSKDELAKALKAQETLQHAVDDREQEILRLTKNLEQAQADAQQAQAKLQFERDDAKRQIADLERTNSELEAKVTEASSAQPTVELDKVLVTNDGAVPAGAGVLPVIASTQLASSGQIVVVNREYDFIVMNLGRNHGLSIGQEFQVVRGDDVLGRVKVEKIYDELSAAAILPDSKKDSFREGDAVRAL